MRKAIVAGNWKMHKTASEAVELVAALKPLLEGVAVEAAVCPPFTSLQAVHAALDHPRLGDPLLLAALRRRVFALVDPRWGAADCLDPAEAAPARVQQLAARPLARGLDVAAVAPRGTGRTAASAFCA